VTDAADPVVFDDDLGFTMEVTNHGPSDASDVDVTTTLPAGTTFVSADPACVLTGNDLTCSAASLVAGASISFDLVLAPTTEGDVTLTADVSSATTDTDNTNDEDSETTTVLASADVSITKSDDVDPVGVGEDVPYPLTVHNSGPSTSSAVEGPELWTVSG